MTGSRPGARPASGDDGVEWGCDPVCPVPELLPPTNDCRAQATRGPAPPFGLPWAGEGTTTSQPPRTVPASLSRHPGVSVPVASDSACPSQGAFSPLKPFLALGGSGCSPEQPLCWRQLLMCHMVWPSTHDPTKARGRDTRLSQAHPPFSLLGILPAFRLDLVMMPEPLRRRRLGQQLK